jgi:hypothetical protein
MWVLKAAGEDRAAFLLHPDGRHAPIADDSNLAIDSAELEWQRQPT